MFKVKQIGNKNVYFSTKIPVEHFFTSRDLIINENKELILNYLNVKSLICPEQTHSDHINFVEKDKTTYPDCDALILERKDCAIYLNFADCAPVILYDKKKATAAISHAGWRGTAAKIAPKTVLKMNSNPNDIIAVIGPCISFECFETSDEALSKLKASVKDPKGLFKDKKADLKAINARQLSEIGVNEMDICPYCTVLDNDKFFSYRKENKTTKRHSALICLR